MIFIEREKMKSKPVTIRDIARETGVSVASVSRALNGLNGISDDTREAVLTACERLGYIPNTLARGLVLKRTQTIGIIVPDLSSPFYSKLAIIATKSAKKLGYQVLLGNSFRNYEMESNYFNLMIGNQVEGIIFYPVGEDSYKHLRHFMRYLPIVSLGQMADTSELACVCPDDTRSGRLATEYLIEKGCKKIIYIGYLWESIAYRERVESFQKSVKQAGIYGEVFHSETKYETGFKQGYNKFIEFLSQRKFIPDGIVASSDEAANGVLKACLENNIRVPQDVSLIGFDNINADLPTLELTSVAVSHENHVDKAIDLLMALKERRSIAGEGKKLYLEPQLYKRNSCKE